MFFQILVQYIFAIEDCVLTKKFSYEKEFNSAQNNCIKTYFHHYLKTSNFKGFPIIIIRIYLLISDKLPPKGAIFAKVTYD